MNKSLLLNALVVLASTAMTAHAADPSPQSPQPIVVQHANAPQPRVETQAGMGNYGMAGMSDAERGDLTRVVKRDRKQLGHGMGGIGATKAARAGKGGKKLHKKSVRKHKKLKHKAKRVRH